MTKTNNPWRPVWRELGDVIQDGLDELEDLNPEAATLVSAIATGLLAARRGLSAPSDLARALSDAESLMDTPPVVRALDLHFADEAVDRLSEWQRRLTVLGTATVAALAEERIRKYTLEVTTAFLYGFDLSCITLCRATLEQIIKEVFVTAGWYTWPDIQQDITPLSKRIKKAKIEHLLPGDSLEPIARIIKTGNTVMHSHPYPDQIRQTIAADCVKDLFAVVTAVYA